MGYPILHGPNKGEHWVRAQNMEAERSTRLVQVLTLG